MASPEKASTARTSNCCGGSCSRESRASPRTMSTLAGISSDGHDLRIDLVKAEDVAGLAVGGERAGAQPDHAGALRPSAAETKSKTHARVRTIVRGRLKAPGRIEILRAV